MLTRQEEDKKKQPTTSAEESTERDSISDTEKTKCRCGTKWPPVFIFMTDVIVFGTKVLFSDLLR